MTGIRRRLTAAALAAVLGTFGIAVAGPMGGPAGAAGPTITVTPDTGLHQDDQVIVEVTGLAPSRAANIDFCPVTGGRCRPATGYAPGGDGTVSTDTSAEFRAYAPDGSDSDCATEGCVMRVSQRLADGSTLTAETPVSFAADQPPLPPRGFTIDPTTPLHDHETVTLHGFGLPPDQGTLTVQQCEYSFGVCSWQSTDDVVVADDGSFTATYDVHRYITSRWFPPVDCAVENCVLRTDQFLDREVITDAPVTFDPAAPADPPPTATVVPDTGLGNETPAHVTGTDFVPGERVLLSECDVASFIGDCEELGGTTADDAGTADADVTLLRLLDAATSSPTDCSDTTPTCVVVLFAPDSGTFAIAPLGFGDPQPIADVTVDPDTDLPYRGYVTVTGHHLKPGTGYHAEQCYPDGGCGEPSTGTADASGDLSLTVLVRRVGFGIPNELGIRRIECTTQCTIHFNRTTGPSIDARTIPITFDPTAPPPPRPTITADPAAGLPANATVHVTGSGFLARSKVAVNECLTAATFPCTAPTVVVADAAGAISADVPVQRMMGTVTPVDCAAAPGTCEVRANPPAFNLGVDPDEQARAPLGFDPSVTPPPAPPLGVSPAGGLRDGTAVHITRAGYPANGLVALLMCRTGATEVTTGCDLTDFRFAFTDAGGNLAADYVVRSRISVASVPVDCRAAPGTCGVAAISAGLGSPLQVVPVTFTRPDDDHHGHGHHHHHQGHHHHHHGDHGHRDRD